VIDNPRQLPAVPTATDTYVYRLDSKATSTETTPACPPADRSGDAGTLTKSRQKQSLAALCVATSLHHIFGSSRITGKDALDLHEKELAVSVTVRHPLDDLYSIVYSFQLTGVHRPANPAHDAPPVTLQSFCKLDQRRYFAFALSYEA
jgi:hypothetical protein